MNRIKSNMKLALLEATVNEIYLDELVEEGKLKEKDRKLIRKYSGKYALKPRNDQEIAE